MLEWLVHYAHFTLALLTICCPQSALPVFVNLTEGMGEREKAGVARQVALTVSCVVLSAAFFGSAILDIFGVSLNSFRIAGGILLMSIAFGMMNASGKRHTKEEQAEAENRDAIGVMPLAVPIITGAGTISAIVIEIQKDHSLLHLSAVCCAGLTIALISWILLRLSDKVVAILGQTGLNIIGRIFGMLLSALGIEFIYLSLKSMFPAWVA